MISREDMSTSFGAVADIYDSGRPDYPHAAVRWMLQPAAVAGRIMRVADVGAGTGKLTRVVVELGADTVAVDPDAEMLGALRENVHGVPTFLGTAEELPLPDAALDAVVMGQAWHWVDPSAASAEIGRVLRPGGVLGLIWNVRDDEVPWVRRFTEIMHSSRAEEMLGEGDPPLAAPFRRAEVREWRWSRPMTRESLFHMVRSRSYIITADPAERAEIETALEGFFDAVGAVGDAVIDLPYVTRAFRAVRP